jgi:peptidoglycan/LPS O-acetylase OafA/YrhL
VSGWLAKRLAPGAAPEAEGKNFALEGLRGICACLVLYAHVTIPRPRLDPGYAPSGRFWWFNLGSVAVLFFFVLSGYVIGLTVREPFSGPEARGYLGRRLLRLVPINTVAVLVGWVLFTEMAPATVLGNLVFLQNYKAYPFGHYVEVMPDNLNLWSLNFEALFYIAFLAVWWMAPLMGWVLCLLGGVAAAAALVPGDHVMASSYAYGAMYWLAGLSAAWLAGKPGRPGNWPSAMLVILVMWPLAPLGHALFLAHVPAPEGSLPVPSLHRIDLLPALVWLLLAVTGRAAAWQGRLAIVCLVWASLGLAWGFHAGDVADPGAMACYTAAIMLAWALVFWRPGTSLLARFAPVGAISYAVYAVGFPIEFGIWHDGWLPSGSASSYALRAAVLVVTTFGLAWLLERKLQPAIRRAIGGKVVVNRDHPS